MTLGCLTILRIWISRVTLSTSDWSLILSFSKILMATFSPVIKWVPRRTLPNVPWPRDRPKKKNHIKYLYKNDSWNSSWTLRYLKDHIEWFSQLLLIKVSCKHDLLYVLFSFKNISFRIWSNSFFICWI
jgi:hypothetical protein